MYVVLRRFDELSSVLPSIPILLVNALGQSASETTAEAGCAHGDAWYARGGRGAVNGFRHPVDRISNRWHRPGLGAAPFEIGYFPFVISEVKDAPRDFLLARRSTPNAG